MALPQADAAKLQKGFAYLTHASRSEGRFMEAAAEEMGTWQDAAFIFAACTTELLHQIARMLGEDITIVCERLTVGAAQAQQQGAAPYEL